MSKSETQTLSFYTTGEGFTGLLRNFINEGSYKTAYQILEDGGMEPHLIKKFFLLELAFEGDTRIDGSLSVVNSEKEPEFDYAEFILTGIRTALVDYNKKNEYVETHRFIRYKDEIENLKYLFKVFTEQEILDLVSRKIILGANFEIAGDNDLIEDKYLYGGAITPSGEYVLCTYDEHKYLFRVLYGLKMADDSEWKDDTMCIHISSGQITDRYKVKEPEYSRKNPATEAQLQTLFKFRKKIRGDYGEYQSVASMLYSNTKNVEQFGGKYAGLSFLKKYYTNIRVPLFSKDVIPNVKNCIRTSPKYSIAGLLESKFDLTDTSVSEIEATFEKHKDVISGNKLHYFYQEYLTGLNGVCNCMANGEIEFMVSDKQGAIVGGVSSEIQLPINIKNELHNIVSELYTDFNNPLQVEFVVHEDKLYIVQFRLLDNNYETSAILARPKNALCYGKTFSKGQGLFNVNDILIVDADAESTDLIGKKALIVRKDMQFSHILALSKSLEIPSMYAVGDVEFPKSGKIKFTAYNKESWIEIN